MRLQQLYVKADVIKDFKIAKLQLSVENNPQFGAVAQEGVILQCRPATFLNGLHFLLFAGTSPKYYYLF